MPAPALFGLVLAGGASSRMGRDKAALSYHGRSQLDWTFDLLSDVCAATFVSVRPDQRDEPARAKFPQVVDLQPGTGPIAGISAAIQQHPKAAWLIVACDLPFITRSVLENLIDHRDTAALATAYRSSHDGLPEPLCAIWEPTVRDALLEYMSLGKQCPRKFLINSRTTLLDLPEARALDNINTSDEFRTATATLGHSHTAGEAIELRVQYYALFREQAGRSVETLTTTARTPNELYRELQIRYPFQLLPAQLKVAVNDEFRDWDTQLSSGDTIVFIPPVAGG